MLLLTLAVMFDCSLSCLQNSRLASSWKRKLIMSHMHMMALTRDLSSVEIKMQSLHLGYILYSTSFKRGHSLVMFTTRNAIHSSHFLELIVNRIDSLISSVTMMSHLFANLLVMFSCCWQIESSCFRTLFSL